MEYDTILQRKSPFLKDFIHFLERREGKEKERERNIDRNLTGDLLVLRQALNPLSHTSQGAKKKS